MAKNKKSSNSKSQFSNKGAESSTLFDDDNPDPVSFVEGGLATNLISKALSAPSTVNDQISLKDSGSGGEINPVDSNCDIVPTNHSSDALAKVQGGVQIDLPSLVSDGPPPLTSPKDGRDPCVDEGQTLKVDLARALSELEEARRDIAVRVAKEKTMANQIDEHVRKIEDLTKANKASKDHSHNLQLKFDQLEDRYHQYQADAEVSRKDLLDNNWFLDKRKKELEAENTTQKQRMDQQLNQQMTQLENLMEKFSTIVEPNYRWSPMLMEMLGAQLASALKQEEHHLQLLDHYRFDNQCLVGANEKLQDTMNLKDCPSSKPMPFDTEGFERRILRLRQTDKKKQEDHSTSREFDRRNVSADKLDNRGISGEETLEETGSVLGSEGESEPDTRIADPLKDISKTRRKRIDMGTSGHGETTANPKKSFLDSTTDDRATCPEPFDQLDAEFGKVTVQLQDSENGSFLRMNWKGYRYKQDTDKEDRHGNERS